MTAEGVVKVRKPLLAVSGCNDKGNAVFFDNENSCILSASAPELRQIRALVRQAKLKIRIQREGGTYTMRTWRVNPDAERRIAANKSGFARLGR